MPKLRFCAPLLAAAALLPTAAFAHPGHVESLGFITGLAHPISGLDHLLAMVMTGLLAAQLKGRAIWILPAGFMAAMAIGGVLGLSGLSLPFIELGIAMSIIILGAALAFPLSTPIAMGLVGFFAIFHGYAHGMEMPSAANALAYGSGFLLTTLFLHLVGVAGGTALNRIPRSGSSTLLKYVGGAASLVGMGFLANLI